MTRRYEDQASIDERETYDLVRRRHRCAADLHERCGDARAREIRRPHDVAGAQILHRDLTVRCSDAGPERETDRAVRWSGLLPRGHRDASVRRDTALDTLAPTGVPHREVREDPVLRRAGGSERPRLEL